MISLTSVIRNKKISLKNNHKVQINQNHHNFTSITDNARICGREMKLPVIQISYFRAKWDKYLLLEVAI